MPNPPWWYVEPGRRGTVPPSEREASEEWDDDHGLTARRARESERYAREWNARQGLDLWGRPL